MDTQLQEAIARWRIDRLFPYQERVIRGLLESSSLRQAVVLPTGAGKSLCFQLPALLLPHPTLVVYPLRSLTADQKRRCRLADIPTVVLQGGQTREQRQEVWRRIREGRVKLILTNPETLGQETVLTELSKVDLSHAVVDEAHCVELWGKSFRPSYRKLGKILEVLSVPRITAFTATATAEIQADWGVSLFCGRPYSVIQASADRPNIEFGREPYLSLRLSLPRAVLREVRPTLIFCRSREQVRRWAQHLHRETALEVRFYHAGLTREEKTAVEDWFLRSDDGVLVATNAYGIPVDTSAIQGYDHRCENRLDLCPPVHR